MYKLILKCAVAISFCVCAVSASAVEYTYTYTGSPFTNILAPSESPLITTSDFLTLSFTTTALLGNNMVDQTASTPILNWSVSDGSQSYSNSTPNTYLSIAFTTNAVGTITQWESYAILNSTTPWNVSSPAQYQDIISLWMPSKGLTSACCGGYGVDGVYIPVQDPNSYMDYNWNSPGTWKVTVSAVPEPETYAMLLAGLGLMGFIAARRKKDPSNMSMAA
jgi:hypothetical protein